MKKLIIISSVLFSISVVALSQNIDDAIRPSQVFQSGTARFNSMAGAFSALGGDISTLNQNPAGLGVFRSSEISLTPMLINGQSTSYFKNNNSEDNKFGFTFSQFGVVSSMTASNKDKGLLALNFGYSMNKSNNYNQSALIKGIGDNSSMADYWANRASTGYFEGGGFYSDELADSLPDAFLAWQTYLIDTLSNQYTTYGSAFNNYGDDAAVYGQTIKRLVESSGYSNDHAFSLGGNISDKFYFGATFGLSSFNYKSIYQHVETVPSEAGLNSLLSNFTYNLTYSSSGTGINFKFGAIYRPVEPLRLSFAFHTPTVYWVSDYVSDNISVNYTGVTSRRSDTSIQGSNNLFKYDYRLKTPSRAMVGAAYQIGRIGLVSVDYELVNYSGAKFSETGDGYDYSGNNEEIDVLLKTSNNLRAGAEIRLSKLYFRGGYAFYGSPWEDGDYNSEKNYKLVSGGVGFRTGSLVIDFSYSALMNSKTYILYSTPTETAVSDINNVRNNFAMTLGFKF